MKKRVLPLLLALLLIVGNGALSFAAFRAHIRVVANEEIQVIRTGERSEYTLRIKNTGNYMAPSLKVEIKGTHPFRGDVSTLTKDISYLSPNESKVLNFEVMASPLAESKIYEFDVVFTYKNSDEEIVTNTEKAYVKIENRSQAPSLSVVRYETNVPDTSANAVNSLNMDVRNEGDASANDVRVTLSGMSSSGIILYNDPDTKLLGSISGSGSSRAIFQIKAGPDAKTGTQTVNVLIEWLDDIGTKYKKEQQVYINVVGDGASSARLGDVQITSISAPKTIGKEQNFTVSYRITNTSASPIAYMEVQFEHPEAFVIKTNSRVVIKDMQPGESRDITIAALTKKEAAQESYHCYLTANVMTPGKAESSVQVAREYVGLYIAGGDEGSKPKLIVSDYKYGNKAMAGEEFDLELTIRNTSTSESTRNIKVTLTGEDSVFTPVDSSNSLFIPSIGPGGEYQGSIRYSTKIDAAVKIYTVNVKMEYEDGQGRAYDAKNNPYIEQETISINVAQPIRLEAGPIQMPEAVNVGESFYVEQEYYNMGKSTMYNLIILIEGVEARTPQAFVGNFEAGRSDYYSVQATINEPGTHQGKLIFRFEDALGVQSQVEKEFTIEAIDMADIVGPDGKPGGIDGPVDPGMMPDLPEEKPGLNLPLIIGGVVLAAGIIAFIIIRVRKSRKARLEDLDE